MQSSLTSDEKQVKKKLKGVSYGKWGLIFLIPFFVAYIIFTLIPQFLTIYYSFFEYFKGPTFDYVGPNFVGLDNYIELFTPVNDTIYILKYAWNTFLIWIIGAVPQLIVSLLLAVIFTSTRLNIKFQGFFKSVFYMPNVIMASAFALLFFQVFGDVGPVNSMLDQMGLKTFRFLDYEIPIKSLIALMNYLMWFGNTTILLMAGIQSIDESVFESARMDGAGSLRVFKDITMPLLKPIFIYVVITSMIGGIQMYDVPQILTSGNGNPNETTMTIVMYLNRVLNPSRNYGMGGAVSVVLFLITGILSLFVFKTMAKGEED
ncbi:MAG: sugar ABC transporter permease [Acholeplasmatales bacterium]|nr:sugar ABC transporter permease [Acholeplasmatales bacterium]